MYGQKFFAPLVILTAFASVGYAQTATRDCPNQVAFGVHPRGPVSRAAEARLEVTYFATDDPGAFIPERAGTHRGPSGTVLNADEFAAKLRGLERSGVARVQSRRSATSLLGEVVALNLERGPATLDGRAVNAAMRTPSLSHHYLDRETQISVTLDPKRDGDYYRVNLLSWFVNATPEGGGWKAVDYDASELLKPGQTMLLKFVSDFEVRRSGPSRKYIAVTLRPAGPAGAESAAGDRVGPAAAHRAAAVN